MTAIIFEYAYEHAATKIDGDRDWEEFDWVIVKLFDKEVTRLPVECWKYWQDGERVVCEDAVLEWMRKKFS